MQCPVCGTIWKEGYIHCAYCGTTLVPVARADRPTNKRAAASKRCTGCGRSMPSYYRFCDYCGTACEEGSAADFEQEAAAAAVRIKAVPKVYAVGKTEAAKSKKSEAESVITEEHIQEAEDAFARADAAGEAAEAAAEVIAETETYVTDETVVDEAAEVTDAADEETAETEETAEDEADAGEYSDESSDGCDEETYDEEYPEQSAEVPGIYYDDDAADESDEYDEYYDEESDEYYDDEQDEEFYDEYEDSDDQYSEEDDDQYDGEDDEQYSDDEDVQESGSATKVFDSGAVNAAAGSIKSDVHLCDYDDFARQSERSFGIHNPRAGSEDDGAPNRRAFSGARYVIAWLLGIVAVALSVAAPVYSQNAGLIPREYTCLLTQSMNLIQEIKLPDIWLVVFTAATLLPALCLVVCASARRRTACMISAELGLLLPLGAWIVRVALSQEKITSISNSSLQIGFFAILLVHITVITILSVGRRKNAR